MGRQSLAPLGDRCESSPSLPGVALELVDLSHLESRGGWWWDCLLGWAKSGVGYRIRKRS